MVSWDMVHVEGNVLTVTICQVEMYNQKSNYKDSGFGRLLLSATDT